MTHVVRAPFGDGAHEFALGIAEAEELQSLCDAGPEFVLNRLYAGSYLIADVRETLRLGLKGGGMDPTKALVLTSRYAGPGHIASHKALACSILGAFLYGNAEDEPPGEPTAGETEPTSPAESGASAPSTSSAAPSA